MIEPRITFDSEVDIWHAFRVPIFIERFVLPICAAACLLLVVTNPMDFDWKQRISGSLAIIFTAYFASHTLYRRNLRQPEVSTWSITDTQEAKLRSILREHNRESGEPT